MTKLKGTISHRSRTARVMRGARFGAFYALAGLLMLFLSFEVIAHLTQDTPS